MLKCVIIDDEPLALNVIKAYVAAYPGLELLQAFEDALSAATFLRHAHTDILFIDINMPDITGIDLVRALSQPPAVIFTTAYRKFAMEGFELDAVDYLLKPISYDRFVKAVHKAVALSRYKEQQHSDADNSLYVSAEYRTIKIAFNDIEYIESLEDYIRIHLINAKPVLTLLTLKKVMEKLPAPLFSRIHRSYIVATSKVQAVFNRRVQMHSGKELPVGDSYAAFIRDWKSR